MMYIVRTYIEYMHSVRNWWQLVLQGLDIDLKLQHCFNIIKYFEQIQIYFLNRIQIHFLTSFYLLIFKYIFI